MKGGAPGKQGSHRLASLATLSSLLSLCPGASFHLPDWITESVPVGLRIPSVVVPGENILLNPQPPDFDEDEIVDPIDWDGPPAIAKA